MAEIKVGMSEYIVAKNPSVLVSIGLGSCVGIVLHDALNKVGGLAHIMLPRRSEAKDNANPAKFADSSINLMVKKMARLGSREQTIKAKIFGGANMFPNICNSKVVSIGDRNTAAVKEELKKRKIELVAEEIGGNLGRTIIFNICDGSVLVKNIKGEVRKY